MEDRYILVLDEKFITIAKYYKYLNKYCLLTACKVIHKEILR